MKRSEKAGPKFRVGDRVRIEGFGPKVETIRGSYFDATYDGGMWRYLFVGEGDYWVPVEEVVKLVRESGQRQRKGKG